MTKKWSNLNLPGALHFVTACVQHRIPIFRSNGCCEAFVEVCSGLLLDWPSKLIAFVLMPDHFHLIVNPRDGDIQGFIKTLKSLSAKRIVELTSEGGFYRGRQERDASLNQVWQQSFKSIPLWSLWMIRQKINYIHANPVKARLVASAKDYPWTSFRAYYFNSSEPLPVDHDWWWSDDSMKLSRAVKEREGKILCR